MTPLEMVREFHEAFGVPIRDTPGFPEPLVAELRESLIAEEYRELRDAADARDLEEVADALADLTYVIYGTALAYGIDLDAVLAEVHRSNMSKLGADGKPIYRDDGKVLKGPGFFRPDIAAVLGVTAEGAC